MSSYRLGIVVLVITIAGWGYADQSHLTQVVDESLRVASLGMPLVRLLDRNPVRRETGRRMVDATLINGAITEALKLTVRSPRPHGGNDGFPSGHTSAAFATALALTEREPDKLWIAIPLAATAGWARVDLEKHTWGQVLAGAALGAFVGHMCGTGQWRIFGHKNAPRKTALTSETAPEEQWTWDGPAPSLAMQGLDWGTPVWSTTF